MAYLLEMGLKVVLRAERLLVLKPGKEACRTAAAKAGNVVADYDFFVEA
jgi:hypothetical protein